MDGILNATGSATGRSGPSRRRTAGTGETRSRRTIQSVERALDLLDILSDAGVELPLNEIAGRAGLNISTCHHLLSTLVKRGYAGQNPRGRSYFLGSRVLELSDSRIRQFNLVETAMEDLRDLNRVTQESIHLAVLQGYDLVTLARLESPRPVRVGADGPGKANAAHATATGKAMLAWLPDTELKRLVAEKGLTRFTDRTVTNLADLIENLRHVRRNGHSLDDQEFQPGVVCVGAAIRDHAGAVIAAVSCSMPDMRATGEALPPIVGSVRDCATILSEKLGRPADKDPADPGLGVAAE